MCVAEVWKSVKRASKKRGIQRSAAGKASQVVDGVKPLTPVLAGYRQMTCMSCCIISFVVEITRELAW